MKEGGLPWLAVRFNTLPNLTRCEGSRTALSTQRAPASVALSIPGGVCPAVVGGALTAAVTAES
jgi:hypothetical protein